jgi:PadR family transcriptional regulator PadR
MPDFKIRLSLQGLQVLRFLSDRPSSEFSGAELGRALNILSGTLYPLLIRFEEAGVLSSRWEEDGNGPKERGRRRLYRLTASGEAVAASHLTKLESRDIAADYAFGVG